MVDLITMYIFDKKTPPVSTTSAPSVILRQTKMYINFPLSFRKLLPFGSEIFCFVASVLLPQDLNCIKL